MTTLEQAARQALDALETRCGTNAEERSPNGAIASLRQALENHESAYQRGYLDGMAYQRGYLDGMAKPCIDCADRQPRQEPMAHLWECIGRWSEYIVTNGEQAELSPPDWLIDAVEAATAPPQRGWVGLTDEELVAAYISVGDKEWAIGGMRNATPVAWISKQSLAEIKDFDATVYGRGGFDDAVPLYTEPPQREWVGLTDSERLEAAEIDGADEWFWKVCKALEAKLKEKNT